jgi:hypothetical protein
MLAHGDDKPVWMTELGWPPSTTCERGGRAGTKAAGVTQAEQADFLAKAYGCLANDPYVATGRVVQPQRRPDGSPDDALNLGLMNDAFARKPAFAAFQAAAGAAPIACGGVRTRRPRRSRSTRRPTASSTSRTLPVDITATDDQGVTDIDVFVDGKEVRLKTNKSGKGAYIKYGWGGAQNLSYGPHTLVVDRRRRGQERRPRVTPRSSTSAAASTPTRVPTTLHAQGRQGQERQGHRRGKIASARNPLISRLAHGRGYVAFSRFDTKAKRWKTMSRFSRDAKNAFSVRYTFKKRGVWRVTGQLQAQGRLQGGPRQGPDGKKFDRSSVSERAGNIGGELRDLGRRPADAHALASSASCLASRCRRCRRRSRRVAHRLAGRRGEARDVGDDRLGHVLGDEVGGLLLGGAADLARHHDQLGLRVLLEEPDDVDEARARDRVAADADDRGVAEAGLGQLVADLVGQRARARDDADVALGEEARRDDADVGLARREDAGQFGPTRRSSRIAREVVVDPQLVVAPGCPR